MCIRKIFAVPLVLVFLSQSAQAEKLIPGWIWNQSPEFGTPEEVCQYAISMNTDPTSTWRFKDATYYNSERSRYCRAYRNNDMVNIYIYTVVSQKECPTIPAYVMKIEPSGLLSCNRYTIGVSGPSSTSALPSQVGPIDQVVTITSEDGPVASEVFSVEMRVNGVIAGASPQITDQNGKSVITYTPPYFYGLTVDLTTSCVYCENTASKSITVLPTDVNQSEEPQMCRR